VSDWFNIDSAAALQSLNTDADRGLPEEEAALRFVGYGPNELAEAQGRGPWLILCEQLTSVLVLILIAASGLSAIVGDYKNSIVILAVVVLFATLGFIQDYRADRAMAALKKLSVPVVRVRRDGAIGEISARSLVPGDILVFEAGNVVPADCRLLESFNVSVDESTLTGESTEYKTPQSSSSVRSGDDQIGFPFISSEHHLPSRRAT
jgi:Ca2+-transporting ATPase